MKQFNHTLIHHFLEYSAKLFPDKIALIHEDTRATYAEINAQADHLAQYLSESGVKPGDRVIMLLENSLDYVVSYYGILKAGAVAVPLSTDLKPDGLNPLLAELEPAALISSSRFERLLKACDPSLLSRINLIFNPTNPINDVRTEDLGLRAEKEQLELRSEALRVRSEGIVQTSVIQNSKFKIQDSSLASIIYTSGSTGKPKGVMLSHQNVVANVHAICESLRIAENDIQMVVLPFFYVMGKSLLNAHFAAGATVVINNKFAYPATVLNQMVDEKVTSFSGVPSTYAYLLHRSPLKKYRDRLDSLRYCSQAGGHMSRQIKLELRKALPGHTNIFIMYGATEASARLTCLAPEKFEAKIDSIGKPLSHVQMNVVDINGAEVPVGREGELVASGPNIMHGYWKDPEATFTVLDAWGYHTGDIGYQDEERFLYVTGRRDDLVKVGGHRINPLEIEDALMATGLVVETAVLSVPDELLGNKLEALVVPVTPEVDSQVVLSRCASFLPKYKLPGKVHWVRALPKNASGKVDREKCLQLLTKLGG